MSTNVMKEVKLGCHIYEDTFATQETLQK